MFGLNSIILFGFSINLNPYSLGSGQTLVQNVSNSDISIHKKGLIFTSKLRDVPEEISLEWPPQFYPKKFHLNGHCDVC